VTIQFDRLSVRTVSISMNTRGTSVVNES